MALIKKFRIKSFKDNENIIEIKNASVFYNKRQILNNLNLNINRQEILGMLGPNGVGKSTIFNLITGLKDLDYGEIIIEGINVLQSAKSKDKKTILEVQDFLNFSIYLDADERFLRQWYIDRFLSLRLAALNNKEDFFNRFSSTDIDQAKEIANSIWEKINLINLNENILPTKYMANLILKKNINHKTNEIWLRNI